MFQRYYLLTLIFLTCFGINGFTQSQKIDSLRNVLKGTKLDTLKMKLFIALGDELENEYPKKALACYSDAIRFADSLQAYTEKKTSLILLKNKSLALRYLGIVHYRQGNFSEAIDCYSKSLTVCKNLDDKLGISSVSSLIGVAYIDLGAYDKAIKLFFDAVKIAEELNNKRELSKYYNNLGLVYQSLKNYDRALDYYFKALGLFHETKDQYGITLSYNNIGLIYKSQKKYNHALVYYKKSLKIAEERKDQRGLARIYGNIGNIYKEQNYSDTALSYFQKALAINEKTGNNNGIAINYGSIALMYLNMAEGLAEGSARSKNLNQALNFGEKTFAIAQKINGLELENESAELLMNANNYLGRYKEAMKYAKIYISTRDSLFNTEKNNAIADAENKYLIDKKEKEIELLQKKEIITEQKSRNQQVIIACISIVILLLALFAAYILYRWKLTHQQKQTIEAQNAQLTEKTIEISLQAEELQAQRINLEIFNEELSEKNDEIVAQRDSLNALNTRLTDTNEQLEMLFDIATKRKTEIERKNKNITSSITYASRIQQALLPPAEMLEDTFYEHFVLFKPRDIVSGDFYWSKKIDNLVYIVAADCTGHGVPGAFMSLLGISLLNDIVKEKVLLPPHVILNKLRLRIKKTFNQSGQRGETLDGMDIAICLFDLENKKLDFAGAYNPLYICRKGAENNYELIEIKGDRMPIGIHPKDGNEFTNKQIALQKGDSVYVFSDGYVSQFGGENSETFKTRRFKHTLLQIQDKSMGEQNSILEKTLTNWKGKREQIDDILVIGVKIA